ncbi:MAG TPA: RNA-binding S4 domain-containing protein [Rhizomicrobium sp.]|jgi:ribosome-associated heat shock protein Hsp15|nr:RNA-binding S4 domain-containing protein [Rhizomicrobium sp.]HEX4533223.1 RNA-binding S4 domain-containing protein [Rhizomicrobium sp.]
MSEDRVRIDKWLWHARFYKTRTLASEAVAKGRVWVNGRRIDKASAAIRTGDVLTLPRGHDVTAVRVCAFAERRGQASQAQALYEILKDSVLESAAPPP